jgi:hypothetical protein
LFIAKEKQLELRSQGEGGSDLTWQAILELPLERQREVYHKLRLIISEQSREKPLDTGDLARLREKLRST